ncbi:short-chain dehydrogenase [Rhizorhabdus wittichii DC-6]|nr:short-chain dehydrogenase [Rhizorhabdus wittichii DC-6]
MSGLKGRNAIVLGASAEGGSGWAIAERLAGEGARVVVSARQREGLEKLADRIGGIAIVADAARPESVAALMKDAADRLGAIDIAINSAAVAPTGLIADAPDEAIRKALDVNYIGNVHFIRGAAAVMNDGGAIVLVSSSSANQPLLPMFPYACAKAAADCLVRYAALEYGPRGIRVNSILPGPIKTGMAAHIYAVPGAEERRAREIPLGRVALPEDIADAVMAFVHSPYLTGHNLPVSGGMHLTRPARRDDG